MDRVGQHFPRAADTILLVPFQHRILGIGIRLLHRGTVAQQPRFAFLDGDSEQRSRARGARLQHIKQFSFERDAIPVVRIDDDNDRSRRRKAPSVSPQDPWKMVEQKPFLPVWSAVQILRDTPKPLVRVKIPGMGRVVRAENFLQQTFEGDASRLILGQNFEVHAFPLGMTYLKIPPGRHSRGSGNPGDGYLLARSLPPA